MGHFRLLKGRGKLLLQASRINLRRSIITLIGITIAISMTSGSQIYLDSSKNLFFLDAFENSEFSEPLSMYYSKEYEYQISNNFVNELPFSINKSLEDHNLEKIIQISNFPYRIKLQGSRFYFNGTSIRIVSIKMYEGILTDSIPDSLLPNKSNDVILYTPYEPPFALNSLFNLTFSERFENIPRVYNFTLNPTCIINSSTLNGNSSLNSVISNTDQFYLILPIEKLINISNTLLSLPFEVHISYYSTYYYSFNLQSINSQNAESIAKEFIDFSRRGNFREEYGIDIGVDRMCFYILTDANREISGHFFSFLAFSIPAFLLAVLLVFFSLGIINETRLKSLLLLKMRGISSKFVFMVLTVETIILSVLASIAGLFLGIPIYIIIYQTIGFIRFDLTRIPEILVVSSDTITYTLFFGFIFTFFAHLRSIISISRTDLTKLEQSTSKKKQKDHGIVRQNFDAFLLSFGIIGLFLITIIIEILRGEIIYSEEITNILLPLLGLLSFFTIISLLVGFLYSYNRITPIILNKISSFFWKKDFKYLSIAARNLYIKAKVTTRVTLLIAISISFLMILASVPISVEQYNFDNVSYRQGTDIRISTRKFFPNTERMNDFISELEKFSNIQIARVMRISLTQKVGGEYKSNINLFSVDNNFSKVAFWKDSYAKQTLEQLISTLTQSNESFPIIIDSFSASRENLTVGDEYISPKIMEISETISMKVVGIFDHWPALEDRWDEYHRFVITTHNSFTNLLHPTLEYETNNYVWCKIIDKSTEKATINQVETLSKTYNLDDWDVRTIWKELNKDPDSLRDNFEWIVVNFNFLVALLVILILITLFTITRMSSHATEIGLSRALGMKYHQIFLLLFIEPLILFLISGVPGSIFSILLLLYFINLLNPLTSSPTSFTLFFDPLAVLLIYGSLVLVTISSGFVTSYSASRANISKILKVE